MKPTDVELPVENCKWSPDDRCLLTEAPGQVLPVTLRRMWLIFMIWVGEAAVVNLPLSRKYHLAVSQYLRMLRPYLCLPVAFFSAMLTGPGTETYRVVLRVVLLIAGFLVAWLAIGRILKRIEPIRLVRLSRDRKRATVRFVDIEAAKRARDALVESV